MNSMGNFDRGNRGGGGGRSFGGSRSGGGRVAIVLQKTVTQSHDDLVIVEIAHQDMILHHEKVEAHRLTTSN